jgi:hormone-sensitive lipase
VYKFLINNIHHYLNVKPKNIILVGDSAGGNLVCSLTSLIIKNKLIVPRSIYLIYPAANLSKNFTYSLLNTAHDPFLNVNMLLLCL